MSQRKLTSSEMRILQESLSCGHRSCSIRLREGEYQYSLAKAIASFQLELHFPDARDIIRKLYGEEKANDIQFVRKIQTILKKMEKADVAMILPKNKPWDLQRYALLSFKFEDADRNPVDLASEEQLKRAQDLLVSVSVQQGISGSKIGDARVKVFILMLAVVASYSASVWALVQSNIEVFLFAPAFAVAVACSLFLGRVLSRV